MKRFLLGALMMALFVNVLPHSPAVPPANAQISSCFLDLMLSLDTSGSISSSEFAEVQNFAVGLVNGLPVSAGQVRVGIAQFSDNAQIEIGLSDNATDVINTINTFSRFGGLTNLVEATLIPQGEFVANGRPAAPRAIIVLTDGEDTINFPGDEVTAATTVKNAGTFIFMVGVGAFIGLDTLNAMSSDPDSEFVFPAPSFAELPNLIDAINDNACQQLGVTITGTVFDDQNADGIFDAGEPGVPGATVELYLPGNPTPETSVVTDANGNYTLLPIAGTYELGIVVPAGFSGVSPLQTGPNDNAFDPTSLRTDEITLAAGEVVNTRTNAGLLQGTGTISGTIFNDLNRDGILDAGEGGVPNVTVSLFPTGSQTMQTTTLTDPNGVYTLVAPAGDYEVGLTPPPGFLGVSPLPMTPGPNDNAFDPTDSRTDPITLTVGGTVNTNTNGGLLPAGAGETPGLYDSATALWQLRLTMTTGEADIAFVYGGIPGAIGVVGDWDGDAIDTPGLYNPANGGWYLRNSNATGEANLFFIFAGPAGAIPVAGDWDGDGDDTPGFYDPATGQWLLRNDNSPGSADITFTFGGQSGFVPIPGDWNNDGTDTPGLYNNATAQWLLRDANSAGGPAFDVIYGGIPTDTPLAGDWDGDGDDAIGVTVVNNAYWDVRNDIVIGRGTLQVIFGGLPGSQHVSGRWGAPPPLSQVYAGINTPYLPPVVNSREGTTPPLPPAASPGSMMPPGGELDASLLPSVPQVNPAVAPNLSQQTQPNGDAALDGNLGGELNLP
ncbi:MAG: VWA domain-containing protein [Chloroflexi bacterium]|nr:VWA domain-containing protein [Chloroflexota bacterium]